MKINKLEGVILTLMLISPWMFWYLSFVFWNIYAIQLTILCLSGFILRSLVIIPAGERGRLIWMEEDLNHFWENGFYLLPVLIPLLSELGNLLGWEQGLHFGWRVSIQKNNSSKTLPSGSLVHLFKDDRLPRKNVDTSFLILDLRALIGLFFKPKNHQEFGTRIILVALLAGVWCNHFYPKDRLRNWINFPEQSVINSMRWTEAGKCTPIEGEKASAIIIQSLPVSMENIEDSVQVYLPVNKLGTSSWSHIMKTEPKRLPENMTLLTIARGEGKICF